VLHQAAVDAVGGAGGAAAEVGGADMNNVQSAALMTRSNLRG
jgi:hypothetical protein